MSAGVLQTLSITGQAAAEQTKRIAKRLRPSTPLRIIASAATPQRLLLAPQDLRTADPTSAADIRTGSFYLAGRVIDCQQTDPFIKTDAPHDWKQELHAFGWLRHLEADGSDQSRARIYTLMSDWLDRFSKPSSNIAWEKSVVARRLISWLCHSVPIVEAADPKFYQIWLKSVGTHIRHLKFSAADAKPGLELLTVRIALAYAALCVSDQSRNLRRAAILLDEELSEQILPDGGHVSRNPQSLVELLTLLLPLRESYKRLGQSPSSEMVSAIDRMMAALKFYRLGDGNLARFNGSSGGRTELLATVLQYDDSLGTAPENAKYSGFQRLAMGDTVVIADTGIAARGDLSVTAHAGTLSFELSSNASLVMVNCGNPVAEDAELKQLARATAAHNTLCLNDTSSSRFYSGAHFKNLLGRRVISGVENVNCIRHDTETFKTFDASHDGYAKSFGIHHSRKMTLADNGNLVEGIDRLQGVGNKSIPARTKLDFAIRFHLHPSVSAGKTDNGVSILMMCGNGIAWKLTCVDCAPEIEESIFFSSATGPKRSKQIVLYGNGHKTPEIRWLLTRQTDLR